MQENKATILSTRPVNPGWVAMAAGKGIVLDGVSFIETTATLPDEAAEAGMEDLYERAVTVIFTSMNAVEAVAARMDKPGNPGKAANGWRIFCIGQATRQRVIRYFGEKAIAGSAVSARALAETILTVLKKEIPERGAPGEVFFFCGDQRRDELPDRLRKESVRVSEIVVYKTLWTAHTIEKQYDGILFFSPSAVDSFFSVNSVREATVLFAIGATTAAAIGSHSHNRVILSESPAKEMLVRQAIEFFL